MNEKSGFLPGPGGGDPNECECNCHVQEGVIHCFSCCEQCPDCGKHIKFGCMESHKKDCPGALPPEDVDEINLCHCSCHETGEKHSWQCCYVCPKCGKNVKIGYESHHEKNCAGSPKTQKQ